MTSNRFLGVAMLVLAGLTGCAMCDNSQDGTYPAFGGKWQRDNPVSGRVGSLFDPAGVQVTDQVTLSEAEPTLAEPETAEATEETSPAEDAAPTEGGAPSEAPEESPKQAPESTLDKPLEQNPPSMQKAETAEPETAENAKPAERAKPAADRDAPDAGLQLPAMPFETPQKEEPKEGGTNLLPPLELPPAP
jgi:hypothetical protein